MNLWDKLDKPFFALAPMADVTDRAFRSIFAKYGKPDVIWTEFISADGLASSGRDKLIGNLKYSDRERPIVAQVFTSNPEKMREAASIIQNLGFDGLDINMGCPDKKIEKQGGGAAMMRNPSNALSVLAAAREGATKIPVSVKTRIGFNAVDLNWVKTLLSERLPALSIHLRTRKEMSKVSAHWELMPEIVSMRNMISPETLIIGNGDIRSIGQGIKYAEKYGCDGIMVGRGVFGNPWFFNREKQTGTVEEKLKVLVEHSKLFEREFMETKSFDLMKKHFKAYVNGWNGAKELRVKLMATHDAAAVDKIVGEYLKKFDMLHL